MFDIYVAFRLAYNFTANTNGPLIFNGQEPCQLTPARGCINNDLELFWLEVDLAADIPNTQAVLHVAVNDRLLDMNYSKMNHMGKDAANRFDQYQRTDCTFMIMELSDISNPKRPFPRDSGRFSR